MPKICMQVNFNGATEQLDHFDLKGGLLQHIFVASGPERPNMHAHNICVAPWNVFMILFF